MPQTIVNLTLPIVTEKITRILNTYPRGPYQEAFHSSELRQKLTAYVISRLPVIYVTMENARACDLDAPIECYSHDQHEQIEQLIHQGIESIMTHRSNPSKRQSAPLSKATDVPSHWFG